MIDKNKITDDEINMAYGYLKDYCSQNNEDLIKFVSNPSNINKASEYIHKQLSLPIRLIIRPAKIAQIITENHDWIIQKAKEKHI